MRSPTPTFQRFAVALFCFLIMVYIATVSVNISTQICVVCSHVWSYKAYPYSLVLFDLFIFAASRRSKNPLDAIPMGLFAAGSFDALTSIAYFHLFHPAPTVLEVGPLTLLAWLVMLFLPIMLLGRRPSGRGVAALGGALAVSMLSVKFLNDWFVSNDPLLHVPATPLGSVQEACLQVLFCYATWLCFRRTNAQATADTPHTKSTSAG